jgi:hypothetical protein
MCQSMYFAGPEGLCLEVATGGDINAKAWIDPEVQELAGINADELAAFLSPPIHERPSEPVRQPAYDPSVPNLVYPEPVYQAMLAAPDEVFWNAVTNEPPVKI